jgi:hypothetical protein
VFGDLLVFPLRATAADPGNEAYRVVSTSRPGRTLELPIFEPGIHFGSIYDGYQPQSLRERPSGYSTLAADAPYDFFWTYNRLNCGAWLPGDEDRLRELGVRTLLFHRGAYAQSLRPDPWFAWRELQRRGLRATVRGGSVWLFPFTSRGGRQQPPPVPEPSRDEPVLCEGWKDGQMKQRDAAMWVYGPADLELELATPGPTIASLWIDGRRTTPVPVDGRKSLELTLDERGWHVLLFHVPALFDTTPARGLELLRIDYAPTG